MVYFPDENTRPVPVTVSLTRERNDKEWREKDDTDVFWSNEAISEQFKKNPENHLTETECNENGVI